MISNSSVLIIFGRLNKIELLKSIFDKIEITESVYDEVVENGIRSNKPEAFIIKDCANKGLISVEKLNEESKNKSSFLRGAYSGLDIGESDTIALAMQKGQKKALIDEKRARKVAELYGILPIGSLGAILLAYKSHVINENEARNLVDKMITNNFRIGADVFSEFWVLFDRIKRHKF